DETGRSGIDSDNGVWLMRGFGVAVLLVVLSGCSVFGKKDDTEPMELVDFESTAKIQKLWQVSVGKGQGPGYTRITPVIDGDTLYVTDYKGRLLALNRANGKTRWQRQLQEKLAGGIGLGDGQLLLGSDEGEVIALSQSDGRELWRTQLTGEV